MIETQARCQMAEKPMIAKGYIICFKVQRGSLDFVSREAPPL